MVRNKMGDPSAAWGSLRVLSSYTIIFAFITAINLLSTVRAEQCMPEALTGDTSAQMVWENRKGPYTYVQTSPDQSLTAMGDDTLSKFTVWFARQATIHLQLWTQMEDSNMFVLKREQVFSAAGEGAYELAVNWEIEEGDHWGFAYDGDDDVPVMYTADSKVRAMSEKQFLGSSSADLGTAFQISQDSPRMFRIQVCTERSQMGTRSQSTSYTCERKPSWDTASDLYPSPLTYINGKKVSTPTAFLKDVEVQMEAGNFITIQIWRKDPANFEFLLVKEKTFYAKLGYNSLPVGIQMQYGDQWGFSLNSAQGMVIKYSNVTSDNSYFFPEFISGVGSKRSYASSTPTPMEFKIAMCFELSFEPNTIGYNNMGGYSAGSYGSGQTGGYYQQQQGYGSGSAGNSPYGSPNTGIQGSTTSVAPGNVINSAYGPVNPYWNNPVGYPNAYGPYGGAQTAFFPQASATNCYCSDNTFWYSAMNTMNGPYTYIDSEAVTEQQANIEAFEVEAHLSGTVTLQIWRPAGPNMNSLYLVWEKEVNLRPGYQRINLAYTVMAGDRWGFLSKSGNELPVKFYDDESSYGHEFQYQVSASTGQQIFLSSAIVSTKKFKIRPCMCSVINGLTSLGGGMPYMTAPQQTYDMISSGMNSYYSNPIQDPNNPIIGTPYPNSNGNYGYSSNNQISVTFSSNGYSQPSCVGVEVDQAGLCPMCGNIEEVGPYTYINFNKLPRGRIETIDVFARNAGSIMLQLWRFDPQSNTLKVFYEKPVGLRAYPPRNRISLSEDVLENDMIGFSYLGGGVVPIQYKNEQGTRSYEDRVGRSTVINNAEINIPQGFQSKLFNIRVCLSSTSQQGQSNYFMNNPQSQQSYYPGIEYSTQNQFSNGYSTQVGTGYDYQNGMGYNSQNGMGYNSQNGVGYNSQNGLGYSSQNSMGYNFQDDMDEPGVIQVSNSFSQLLSNFVSLLNQGMSIQDANKMGGLGGNSGMCEELRDGEANGPFESKIKGPYTYVGDFPVDDEKCVRYIKYQASSYDEIVFFKARPKMGGKFEIVGETVSSVPESLFEPTLVEVQWQLEANEKIGFYYEGTGNVPIKFTYSWGNSLELPLDSPADGIIPQLYETSKSFEISIHASSECSNQWCRLPGEQQQQQQNFGGQTDGNFNWNNQWGQQLNSQNIQWNNNNMWDQQQSSQNNQWNNNMWGQSSQNNQWDNNMWGQSSQNNQWDNNMWGQQTGYSANAGANAGYSSNGNNMYGNYQFQRVYISPGSAMNPLLDQQPTALSGPSCIGAPIDNQLSLAGLPGDVIYVIPETFARRGRLKHIELESSKNARILIFHIRERNNGSLRLMNAIEYNIHPGINKIPQQYLDWRIRAYSDNIGFITIDQTSPITYTQDPYGNIFFNFNACVEDTLYHSPTTYNNPSQNQGFTGSSANMAFGASNGDTCSCYDNSHWPFAFEEAYGPFTYINGEDFRQITGFVKAFEIEAAIAGPVTLHIWRKSSPLSDRVTKIYSREIMLQAGYQRIEGINTNFQEGDLWGFTFNQNGMVPINFLTDTNYFGYEVKDPALVATASTNVMYLSSANLGFKRFKMRPCVCTYSTQSNVNQLSNAFFYTPGFTPTVPPTTGNSAAGQASLGGYSTSGQSYGGQSQQGYASNVQTNPIPGYQQLPVDAFAAQTAYSPQYPTNTYQYCYGSLGEKGNLVMFGPYTHVNFEPLPEGVIENVEFEATRPGTLTWYIWRQNAVTGDFEVVSMRDISFQSGKQSVQFMEETNDRDLIGFHFSESEEIPIKFAEDVGAQAYEDMSPIAPVVGTPILPPNNLEDKLFNYKVCMYSVTNANSPLQTTSNIGGYGHSYIEQTAPYYASGQNFGPNPGFGPSPSPMPGYDYGNNYFPDPTYGISQYDPVQAYNYDYYQNPSGTRPTYGSSTRYPINQSNQGTPTTYNGAPYGYGQSPYQSQYPNSYQQTQGFNAAYNQNYAPGPNYQGGYYY